MDVIFRADGWEQHITARYLVGPMAQTRWCGDISTRTIKFVKCRYPALVCRETSGAVLLLHLDNAITDCYSWSISKDGYFILAVPIP